MPLFLRTCCHLCLPLCSAASLSAAARAWTGKERKAASAAGGAHAAHPLRWPLCAPLLLCTVASGAAARVSAAAVVPYNGMHDCRVAAADRRLIRRRVSTSLLRQRICWTHPLACGYRRCWLALLAWINLAFAYGAKSAISLVYPCYQSVAVEAFSLYLLFASYLSFLYIWTASSLSYPFCYAPSCPCISTSAIPYVDMGSYVAVQLARCGVWVQLP